MFYVFLDVLCHPECSKKCLPKIFLGEARRDTMLPSISSFWGHSMNDFGEKICGVYLLKRHRCCRGRLPLAKTAHTTNCHTAHPQQQWRNGFEKIEPIPTAARLLRWVRVYFFFQSLTFRCHRDTLAPIQRDVYRTQPLKLWCAGNHQATSPKVDNTYISDTTS